MYDVIVIGARCAGSPAAMLLAQRGFKVLLADKAGFPSDTISTHIIFLKGVERLKKWGLLDSILATNCPVISKMVYDTGSLILQGSPPLPEGVPGIIAPRRTLLDKILLDAAINAGATFRDHCIAEEILFEDGKATGVRFQSKGGSSFSEKAKLVIGADGRNSLVAKSVKAEEYNAAPALTCWYYTYWSGLPVVDLVFYAPPNRAIGTIATNNGLTCIPVACPAHELKAFRSDIDGNYMKSLAMVPELAEMIQHGKQEERLVGMTDVPNFFRKPFGPGWVLAGDAGYHKDPITGQGISDAFRDAGNLADTIEAVLEKNAPYEESFTRYQQKRDEECLPMYGLTCDWAKLEELPPDTQYLFSVMATRQIEMDRFFGTLAGTVRIEEFFAPENIERIVAG